MSTPTVIIFIDSQTALLYKTAVHEITLWDRSVQRENNSCDFFAPPRRSLLLCSSPVPCPPPVRPLRRRTTSLSPSPALIAPAASVGRAASPSRFRSRLPGRASE